MNVLAPYDVDDDRGFREGQRWPWIVLGVIVVVLLVIVAALIWVRGQVNPSGDPGPPIRIRVEQGMSVDEIGSLLEDKGIIKSASVWRYYARLNGADSIQAGDYTIRQGESMGEVIKILEGGAEVEQGIPLTIPEGLTLKEIAAKVAELPGRSADAFLRAAESGTVRSQYQPANSNNLEGLILPETYFLGKDDDETAILRRMVETFDQAATELGLVTGAARNRVTPYEVVIIASMVEREARLPEERGQISRVIYNRLANDMRLQIDATVLYALGERKNVVLFSDLEVNSPYNTYKVDGLPPGPIASPGRKALEAAISPAPGPWLYYVLIEENGKHAFATTNEEFARNLAEARRKGLAG
ncbi:MAG: endolytic transglycosylase MltG [Actinomycetota bacterium]|nr:endolytic transglycosylase MltG [Actinomycetota bacterium]